MAHYNTWLLDRVRFRVTGDAPQRFLTLAAQKGVQLRKVSGLPDGYCGEAAGADLQTLERLAGQGGWTLEIRRRAGPGRTMEWFCRRPGVMTGMVVLALLVRLLGGFVWNIEFGDLDSEQVDELRTVLGQYEIWEGAYLDEEKLSAAQLAVSGQTERFGWISLNFNSGCLVIESAPAEFQTVRMDETGALVAKAGGRLLALRAESGFTEVKTGQYVTEGQLLVNAYKLDRKGAVVEQAASGQIVARVEKTYEAVCRTEASKPVLTGRSVTHDTFYWLGNGRARETEIPYAEMQTQTQWIPLTLGRLALPGCIYRQTFLEEETRELTFTREAAAAQARRDCYLQLMAEFPDAEIESSEYEQRENVCVARYIFCADIAEPGQPIMPEPEES